MNRRPPTTATVQRSTDKGPIAASGRRRDGHRQTARATPSVIAVTPGEPGGIGPEITARLFGGFTPRKSVAVIVASRRVAEPWLQRYAAEPAVIEVGPRGLGVTDLLSKSSSLLREALTGRGVPRVFLLDTGCRARYTRGRDTRGGGQHSGLAIEVACHLAREGVLDGLVTGPVSKKSLRAAGYPFTGHTEMLSRRLDAPDCQMVMVYRDFRVVPLTRHLPLKKVSRAVSAEKILACLRVLREALIGDFGVGRPRIAVSGLNPHAGDAGVLGAEETEVIEPALKQARLQGIRVVGPVSADALFQEARSGTFDAFVTMYHDQGLIPFKMVSMRRGVNVTIGLPIVRTSVDHGVAYDIVGQGIAGAHSLRQAYRLAEELVNRRNKS